MKPETKQTTYTQSNTATLPTLDPTKQDVAKPFEPSNKTGSEAAAYLVPETGESPPMSADAVRNSAQAGGSDDSAVVVASDPTAEAAKKAAAKAEEEANEPSAFDKVVGHVKESGSKLKKDFVGDDTSAIYSNSKDLVGYDDGKVNVKYDKIADRIDSAFGTPGASRTLTGTTKDNILGAVEIYGGKALGVNLEDAVALLDPDQYTDATSITSLISRVTESGGVLDVLDLGAQSALIHGLAETLMKWKVPYLIDKLIDMIQEKKDKEKMYEEMCIRAASMGDVDLVEHYGDKIEGKRRRAIWEQVVRSLLSRFYVRRDDTRSHTTLGSKLLRVLAMFNSEWDKDPYDGNITSLYYYSIVSIEAEIALRHTDRRIHAAAGRVVREESPWTTITRNFEDLN